MKLGSVFFVFAIAAALAVYVLPFLPKKLETPQRWICEAHAVGVVSEVTKDGIIVLFRDNTQNFFLNEYGYTNGQSVHVTVAAHFVRYYQTSRGTLEWFGRSVTSTEVGGWSPAEDESLKRFNVSLRRAKP